jgi:hypothetical protein
MGFSLKRCLPLRPQARPDQFMKRFLAFIIVVFAEAASAAL